MQRRVVTCAPKSKPYAFFNAIRCTSLCDLVLFPPLQCSNAMSETEKLIKNDERDLTEQKQAQADRQRRLVELDSKLQEVTVVR
jgi:hypothetical protein